MRRMILAAALLPALWAGAHPADISHLRMEVGETSVRFRFSLNIATLDKLHPLDADRDGKATLAEIEAAIPTAREFVKRHTLIAINDTDAHVGDFTRFECLWPDAATTAPLFPEWPGRFVDIAFEHRWREPVKDVWIGYQWFDRLSDLHTIESVIRQPGQPDLPVHFSVAEPEFLYDATVSETPEKEVPAIAKAEKQPNRMLPVIAGIGLLVVGLLVMLRARYTSNS
jgi:hypothetical protein